MSAPGMERLIAGMEEAAQYCRRVPTEERRVDWIVAQTEAITALATMAFIAVGLLVGGGQIPGVWHGISTALRAGERRERDHERRHLETMDAKAGQRHESQERRREAMEATAVKREALEALIERTAPRPEARA